MRKFFRNLSTAPFYAAVAALAVQSGLRNLIHPHDTTTSALLTTSWHHIWAWTFLASGILIIWGLGEAKQRIEAAGLSLFIGGIAVQALAYMVVVGGHAWPTFTVLTYFGLAAGVRLYRLLKGERQVWITEG